jgi:hypothetical protein
MRSQMLMLMALYSLALLFVFGHAEEKVAPAVLAPPPKSPEVAAPAGDSQNPAVVAVPSAEVVAESVVELPARPAAGEPNVQVQIPEAVLARE